ncbi:type VII secretion protein EccB [Jidongwangia harbinensis]|uniref:type VII secretion protein EccB n=1 Tax=Jidongwangia harbinensis TaxID=2878561 RepID=UPI001CD9FB15|nr:type VII secretion protein EccB [Jidongwangia harbinensis]MCA2218178.1 type VII secretion protein EccB [Jidongwangia harbinensis]
MASRRDQLQAQRFLAQRVHSALVICETDPEQPPFRRPTGAAFGSVALALVALLAVGAYGFLHPGANRSWRTGDAVIVVKETGARYVYVGARLHPVLNYTSALLALGRHAPTRSVSRNSLVGVPRGPRIGIPDAPDALPEAGRLLTAAWTLCSSPAADRTGAAVDESVLLAGADPTGARPLGDAALLVEVPESGDQYLIWRGHRHRIRQPDRVTVGLALRAEARARVGPALVDILPSGDPIAPLAVRDAGKPSRAVPRRTDLRIGQLLVVQTPGGGVQHYLAEADRLRAITELQYDIQLAARSTAAAYPGDEPVGLPLGLTAAAEARQEAVPPAAPAAAPARRPPFAGTGTGPIPVCVTYDDGMPVPRIRVGGQLPPPGATVATPGRTAAGLPLADRVHLPPGRAAVVEVLPSSQAPSGTLVLATDQGRAHPLASREVLGMLGYGRARPVRLPASLVTRLPMGSGLDPAVAATSPR